MQIFEINFGLCVDFLCQNKHKTTKKKKKQRKTIDKPVTMWYSVNRKIGEEAKIRHTTRKGGIGN